MSEYTPTTDEMRNVYASVQARGIRSGPPGAIEYNHGKAKFDRWLAEVERAAAALALEEAARDQRWARSEHGHVRAWLRTRAAEYQQGKITEEQYQRDARSRNPYRAEAYRQEGKEQ